MVHVNRIISGPTSEATTEHEQESWTCHEANDRAIYLQIADKMWVQEPKTRKMRLSRAAAKDDFVEKRIVNFFEFGLSMVLSRWRVFYYRSQLKVERP
jgi:hypothetical protein